MVASLLLDLHVVDRLLALRIFKTRS
eukprot:COSAG01_NODE_58031_length_308_cov_1.464115_1_plen_25_part_01